ncbi:glycosyltransferase [Seonamhaeicola sp. ML3]|uniref:glycosyltransferase family 2 protein n=1 Tax=Seonamhaeicola sp. ML3 TaxID=2937786 RepID=UPI00200F9C76|nr:glycosyltransferase [Seonamhaeicola sp. ML3]
MKVSIITATYNSENFIESTIKSVISQSHNNWELIIIDDASGDDTVNIVEGLVSLYPDKISILKNKTNRGAAVTRNRGVESATGDFIAFLDGDDIWKPHKLEKQVKFMLKHNADICFSSYDLMNEAGISLNKTIQALPVLSYKKFLKCNYIGNLTGVYNAKTLGKIYAPNLRKRQDWLMWLEAVKRSKSPAMGMKESLAIYRVRENSISSNKFDLLKYNYWIYNKGLGFSAAKSVYRMTIFFFEYFFVKPKQTIDSLKT